MLSKLYEYRGRNINFTIYEESYNININGIAYNYTIETIPFKDIDIETACRLHIDKICDELDEEERKQKTLNTPPTQEEIQAEILLNQSEILANQNSQDEVLAEILLNSLEVSTNV